jgi:hypothetical protein
MRNWLVLTASTGILIVGGPIGLPTYCARAAQETSSAPAVVAKAQTTAAVVEDVDPQDRQLLLRLPDYTLLTLKLGKQVKDLSQLKPGDHVRAEYVEARLLGINRTEHPGALQTITNGPKGTSQGNTTIVALDPNGHTVSFVGPGNVVQTIHISGDAMIQAVTRLQPGDRAEVAYLPAVAIAIHRV